MRGQLGKLALVERSRSTAETRREGWGKDFEKFKEGKLKLFTGSLDQASILIVLERNKRGAEHLM